MLAVVIFLIDSLREQRSVPRPDSQVLHVLKILAAHGWKIAALELVNGPGIIGLSRCDRTCLHTQLGPAIFR